MHRVERTLEVPARAETVWRRCYEDAAAWAEWNPELVHARLDGPLRAGATARIRFRTGLRLRFCITECEPGRVFTDEARLPGARVAHRHLLAPTAAGVRLVNTISFTGPLAGLYARLMGPRAGRALEEGQRRIAALVATGGQGMKMP